MPTQIFLPKCLMDAYRHLFPNLDFSRVRFHVGIPLDTGEQSGQTLTSGWSDINVYIRDYDPCSFDTFLTFAHELVHAQQAQDGDFGGKANTWIFFYLKSAFTSFSSDRDHNPLEKEAYEFEDDLKDCAKNPCNCVNSITWIVPVTNAAGVPDVVGQLALNCPNVSKPRSTHGDDKDRIANAFPGGRVVAGIWEVLMAGIAIFAAIIYSIVDSIISLFQLLIDAFRGEGSLNVMFSTNDGLDWGDKLTFERSSEQPAIAFGPDPITFVPRLFIAWTGTDEHLNVMVTSSPPVVPTPFEKVNDDAGPAAVFALGKLYVAWQSEDNKLNVASSMDGKTLPGPVKLAETAASNANPALTFGNGRLFLAWTGTDNRINLMSSVDGVAWQNKLTLNEKSGDDGSPALAFGNGVLYLAWTGTDSKSSLNVLPLTPNPVSGALGIGNKVTLSEYSSDDAGPALAFGNGKLFLSWTGSDDKLNVMSSVDGQTFSNKRTFEESKDNAGPALTFDAGILCVAWVGKG